MLPRKQLYRLAGWPLDQAHWLQGKRYANGDETVTEMLFERILERV